MDSEEILRLVAGIEARYSDAYTPDGRYIEGDWHRLEWFLRDFTIAWPELRDAILDSIGERKPNGR